MEANPAQMRQIGNALNTIGGEVGTDAESARGDADKAGTGNDGFTSVAAAASTADTWIDHVVGIGNALTGKGGGLIAAANDIEGTDIDNSGRISSTGVVPV